MTEENSFMKLDDHLCFSIYACSRAILHLYRPHLDDLNLTYSQYLVLVVLWEHKKATVKKMGQLLALDSGTLTPMLKRMEAAGLVERKRDPSDERVVIVSITGKGTALRDKAQCIPESLIEASGMTAEEMDTFNQMIKKLSSAALKEKV